MEIKLWMSVLFVIWLVWTICSIITIIQTPFLIFKRDTSTTYVNGDGEPYNPAYTGSANTWIIFHIIVILVLFIYWLTKLPWNKVLLTL